MVIDGLFTGTKIQAVKPAQEFVDGRPTGEQKKRNGIPVWTVEVAVRNGEYVLPLRLKVTAQEAPEPGTWARFLGVEVNVWNGTAYFSAEGFEEINGENLSDIFGGEDE